VKPLSSQADNERRERKGSVGGYLGKLYEKIDIKSHLWKK
jgi:hypothetical protein